MLTKIRMNTFQLTINNLTQEDPTMEVKQTTPYGPKEEYVGRRRSSSSLDLEDSFKKCNEMITHLQEQIMK